MAGVDSRTTPLTDPAGLRDLRADLAGHGVDSDALSTLLGPVAAAALRRDDPVPVRRRLRDLDGPLATFVRFFTLGDPVDAAELDELCPSLGAGGLLELGLAAPAEGGLRATCDLMPYGADAATWLVASDHGELALGSSLPHDHVLGVGGASTTLASWTPRPQVARALDLGTGCGVQALHLSTHCREVVATDVSARALGYASVNAALADVELDLRSGSLLEPVAGERFDLVVSNPPFVITPRREDVPVYEYRDGQGTGHEVVADLVRGVGDHLEPGGLAVLLGNWETGEGGDWRDVVGGWLDDAERRGTPLDAWVVQREEQDPAEYAATWVRDGGQRPGTPEHAALEEAWLADFAARGVARIGFGVIVLQRPAGERGTFRDLVDHRGPVEQPMGPRVLEGVRARTWLAEHDDDAVLDVAWHCAPDVIEERHTRPGESDPVLILARQGAGLGRTAGLDTLGAALLSVCDGELTARQAVAAIAGLLDLDAAQAHEQAVALLRELVADGFVAGGATDRG